LAIVGLGLATACGNVTSSPSPDARAAGACDLGQPFGAAKLVGGAGINTADDERAPRLSPDELTMYFASTRQSPGTADYDLYAAARPSRSADFNLPVHLTALSSSVDDRDPSVRGDGLVLYFHSARGTSYDIYQSTRTDITSEFGAPVVVPAVNTSSVDEGPSIRPDGKVMYFMSNRSGQYLIYRSAVGANGFDAPVLITAMTASPGPGATGQPVVTDDDLTLFYTQFTTETGQDIWEVTRASTDAEFANPHPVTELNTSSHEEPGWVSPDGCRMYFWSDRAGSSDLWLAERPGA
jgi:Tol biopolymer transport system component